ncbi:TolB family protein [Nonomuraea sp. NPDC050790]|uniref:TolB family protein n=1 Tax=Nonomuraea sp. NPDC050790 TaxID=3364371 RepID=UPI0037A6D9E4
MLILAAIGALAVISGLALSARSLPRANLDRFARRHRLTITPYNGDGTIAYLRAVRSWRGAGLAAGGALSFFFLGNLNFLFLLYGWLAGVLVSEIQLAATRPRFSGERLRLTPTALTVAWRLSALACWGVVAWLVVRSFSGEMAVLDRVWVAIPALVLLAVHLVLWDLHRRAVPAGTSDLVGAEFAARISSARTLMAFGIVAALLPAGGLLYGLRTPPPAPPASFQAFADPIRFAWLASDPTRWELQQEPGNISAYRDADTSGPLAISGDGNHLVYLQLGTGRLVHRDLRGTRVRELDGTGEVLLSHDGAYAAVGTTLVHTPTGAATPLPGVARVIGIGGGKVAATTGRRTLPGAPATELVVFDVRGKVLSRAPFDPSLDVRLSPDGGTLAVVTQADVLTMDPETAGVRTREPLKLNGPSAESALLGWSADGRRLVLRADQDDVHLVDPRTGTARKLQESPEPGQTVVAGRLT